MHLRFGSGWQRFALMVAVQAPFFTGLAGGQVAHTNLSSWLTNNFQSSPLLCAGDAGRVCQTYEMRLLRLLRAACSQ